MKKNVDLGAKHGDNMRRILLTLLLGVMPLKHEISLLLLGHLLLVVSCFASSEFELTPEEISKLEQLRSQPKFGADDLLMYPGAPSERVRIQCEKAVNAMLGELIRGLDSSPNESFVFDKFRRVLGQFESEDSEERDRVLSYLDDVMDILGIESSGGLLNEWRYGFKPDDA